MRGLGSPLPPPPAQGASGGPKAHVLPLSVDPVRQNVYLLFCVNRTCPGWPTGSSAITLLGGSARGGESAEQAAAREFYEETMGTVLAFPSDDTARRSRVRSRTLAARLCNRQFLLRLDRDKDTCFVLNVPWDPHCLARFQHSRSMIGALESVVRQQKRAAPDQELGPRDLSLTVAQRKALFPEGDPHRQDQRHKWLVSHDAVIRRRGRGRGRTPVIGVKRECLEKQKLLMASIPQAREAVARNGRMLDQEGNLLWMTRGTLQTLKLCVDQFL